jgi:hypothetical protein
MANREISMWSLEVICAATVLASLQASPILEVGTYIGGGTVALGRGARTAGRRVICLEKGGSHPTHEVIPSKDILHDLRTNLARFEVSDVVTIIEGNYGEQTGHDKLRETLDGQKIGLVCIDADGHVDRTLNVLSEFFAPDALFIIDDYQSPFHRDKSTLTKPTVDRLCELGFLEPWGLITGQTWFGRSKNLDQLSSQGLFVSRILGEDEIEGELGHMFVVRLPMGWDTLSDTVTGSFSPLVLLEDGQIIGPPHYPFDIIRKEGRGCYVHWGEDLWFSTSDNTDPRTNGRTYEVLLNRERVRLVLA